MGIVKIFTDGAAKGNPGPGGYGVVMIFGSHVKEYFSNQDTQQSITVATSFASDAFKVLMASLLCIFVPQQCDNIQSNKDIFIETYGNNSFANTLNGTTNLVHICTFNENFTDLIDYNTFVLAFNFITLGIK